MWLLASLFYVLINSSLIFWGTFDGNTDGALVVGTLAAADAIKGEPCGEESWLSVKT
jgi:hypothetical protein